VVVAVVLLLHQFKMDLKVAAVDVAAAVEAVGVEQYALTN
jgi:hypothetical protein